MELRPYSILPRQSFKAKLSPAAEQVLLRTPKGQTIAEEIKKIGSPESQIDINKISSMEFGNFPNGSAKMLNEAEASIWNPLFGEYNFELFSTSSKKELYEGIYGEITKRDIKKYEEEAMRKVLTEYISERNVTPFKALDILIEECKKPHGFDSKRIEDFKKVAFKIMEDIYFIGLKILRK